MSLDPYEVRIIRRLGFYGPQNTAEIADHTGMAWATAQKRIEKLHEAGYIIIVKKTKKTTIWGLKKRS